jgi:hypothetical protein
MVAYIRATAAQIEHAQGGRHVRDELVEGVRGDADAQREIERDEFLTVRTDLHNKSESVRSSKGGAWKIRTGAMF